jgi:hypothetical protein
MRKTILLVAILLGAAMAGITRQPKAADPVRVALSEAQFAFPAQLMPQVAVGGTAEPIRVESHWYRPLRAKDGSPLRFGYVQSNQDPAIDALSVEITGQLLSGLPGLTPDQRMKLVGLDFVEVALEQGTGPTPALDRLCAEISKTRAVIPPSSGPGFNLLLQSQEGYSPSVWLSRRVPAMMTCSEQLPMVNESWGLACSYYMPLAPDIWVGGRLYDKLTPAEDWEATLTLLAHTLRGLAGPSTMPELQQVHVIEAKNGSVCASQ